ncbi:alpha/beta hydrolase [Streptomyces sp. NBC_00988]|uniref:alpha/beta fold hydrolase n=1 Tax=Streptomyces sp. NBC_00988 TaxID=2903704 RepID=UPI00386937CB|nr:alpha/beta hydrolase [Streptomyces sp. NBC_00988]
MTPAVPPPPTPNWHSRFVSVDGVRTHYLEAGEGPPLVLLHSGEFGGCAELSWEYLIGPLSENFRVLAPDWLGYGRTDKIHDFGGKRGRMLAHLRRFLEVMEIGRADFVGNSMGATWLTQEAALVPPGLPVNRIVVLSGAGYVPDNAYRRMTLDYDCTPEGMRRLLSAIFHSPVWSTDPAYVERRNTLATAPGAWEAVAAARFKSPLTPPRSSHGQPDRTEYELVTAPTLLIAGKEDKLREPGYATGLAERIKGCELLVIPDCGHCPNIERPDVVLSHTLRFLAAPAPMTGTTTPLRTVS